MAKYTMKPLAGAVGAAFMASALVAPLASASANPFQVTELNSGYNLAAAEGEGKCGEGKCGEGKAKAKADGEGKCGEGKCGEGKAKSKAKAKAKAEGEGKCGEGKCGGSK